MKDRTLKGGFSIAFKLFFVLLFLILVLTSTTTFFMYERSKEALREETRSHLVDLAKTTALMVDVDKHSQLEVGDENTENYKEVRAVLQSVMAANPKIDDIYTMVRSDEENIWLFVVDTHESKQIGAELATTSTYYDPMMELALEHPVAGEEILEWGSFRAMAPIYDSNGTAVAILGIDMNAGTVLAAEKRLRSIIAIIFLGALLLSMIVSILFARHFTRPIDQLKLGTARVIKGDLSLRIESDRKDEFGALATAFNHMTVSLQEHIEKLKERTTEVEKHLRHKDEFITQLGHDLKTPLTPLVALLPIVKEREKDPKSKELLEVAIHNVNYMKDLVTKTLQLAMITSPDVELLIEDINLLQVVINVIESEKYIFKENDVTVENKINGKIIVKADRLRLEELFGDLITNAVKFTPDGGGTITIDAKKDTDFVTISVKDTGIGIAREQLEHIFDVFYKADESRHELESSGLGLSICKRMVEKHGGKIWAESPGKGMGSTFYFTLKSGSEEGVNVRRNGR